MSEPLSESVAPSHESQTAIARLARWIARDAVAVPLSIFIGSRLAIFAMASLFIGLIPVAPGQHPGFLAAFRRWDGGWYSRIVKEGYAWAGPDHQSSVAFFPLYPLVTKIVSVLVLGNVGLALMVVSNVSFLLYLFYLYRLAARDFDAEVAERSVLYVAIFGLAIFFSADYAESLMLALATAAFFYAREGKWTAAIVLGALTASTRFAGLVIMLPLTWEWYQQKGVTLRGLVLLAVPAGLALYMIYMTMLTGDPLAFITVEKAWQRSSTWPWGTVGLAWDLITRVPRERYVAAILYVDFGCMVGFLALSLAAIRRMPTAYSLYSLPLYFMATSTTLAPEAGLATASIGRYLMSIFPAFVMMGILGRTRFVHYALLFMFAVLLGPLTLYYFANIWVE